MKIYGYTTALPIAGSMAGGTTFYHEVCKAFVKAGFYVEVQTHGRLRKYKTQVIDGVIYSPSASSMDADIIFLHSAALDNNPQISHFKQPVVYLVHSESDLIIDDLNALSSKDILISNSKALQEKMKYLPCQHFLLYPICNELYLDRGVNTRKYITCIGSSVVKNIGLFYDLAKTYPREKFLHIKGGYGNDRHRHPENVTVINNTEKLKNLYNKTRILIVPSFSETYSLVAREAGLQGIPVIASDLPGIRENLGAAGLYADPNSVRSFCDKINFLKDKNNYRGASRLIYNHCTREEKANRSRVEELVEFLRHLHI